MFKQFIRRDSFKRSEEPKISIRRQHIGFSEAFVRKANLQSFKKVRISIDEENFRIGFEFHNSNDPNSLSLFSDNPSGRTKATSAVQLIRQYGLIKKISEMQNPLDRQFEVEQDIQKKGFWIAILFPVFEYTASSESDLRGLKGIYRYKRSDGTVVYIGRGNILSRFNSPDRTDWDFDVVEYSIIEDPKKQSKWERYWLDKYKEKEDRLPFYNKINGKKGIKND